MTFDLFRIKGTVREELSVRRGSNSLILRRSEVSRSHSSESE